MNKFIKLLSFIIICLGIFSYNKVLALGFLEGWKTSDVVATQENLIYNNYTSYLDGYLNSYVIENEENYTSSLTYYDKEGNTILVKNDIPFRIDDLATDGENIYALYYQYSLETNDNYGIVLFDKNFDIQKRVILKDYNRNNEIYQRKLLGDSLFFIENNNIIINSGSQTFIVDNNLANEFYESSNQFYTSDYNNYNVIKGRYNTYNGNKIEYKSTKMKNNVIIASGLYYKDNCETKDCMVALVSAFNKDYNKLWTKEYSEYSNIQEAQIIGNYIVGIANNREDNQEYLIIMDKNGTILNKAKTINNVLMLKDIGNGFIVTNYISDENVTFNSELYKIMNTVTIKKNGKGHVEISGSGIAGSTVKFKIIPDSGYTLSSIVISDNDNNKIKISNNSFIMPDSDVVIEATFVDGTINPETADLTIIILFVIATVALFATAYLNKEKKWFK